MTVEKRGIGMKRKKGWKYAVAVIGLMLIGGVMLPKTMNPKTTNQETINPGTTNQETMNLETTPLETMSPGNETSNGTQQTENEFKEITKPEASNLEVHFIDVGQGDATLIKADGQAMLIDAGENDKGTAVQLYLQKQGVDKLDYLVLTHPDADHIGGADVIITKFDIGTVFMTDFEKDGNKTYEDVINALDYKGLKYVTPEVGSEYTLGNAVFTIVAPNRTYNDSNNSSIALVLTNGGHTFLFTGDCEEEAEKDILANGLDIDCDIYKVGHHGSSTSSSEEFLKAVTPDYAIISCAEENSYGHPHAETLNKLRSMGVQIFRTDEQGSIVVTSDGTQLTWNCAPSDTWQAGERRGTEAASTETAAIETIEIQKTEIETATTGVASVETAATELPTIEATSIETTVTEATVTEPQQNDSVIGNKNTKVFHKPTCNYLPKEKNQVIFNNREEALAAGYNNPCDYCNP